VSPAETAEPIKMPFGLRTLMVPGNHVLDGAMGRGNFVVGKGRPIVKYRDTVVICAKAQIHIVLGCGLG